MRQPENFDMFYGLSDSRAWADNAELPTQKDEWPGRMKKMRSKNFSARRLTPC